MDTSPQPSPYAATSPTAAALDACVACRAACPVGTDAEAMCIAVEAGRYLDAWRIARSRNPFPGVCSRLCEAPCEAACVRSNLDAPVALRALERFVSSLYGAETGNQTLWAAERPLADTSLVSGSRVAVVGAGPAGLTCAHDLALMGMHCDLFEREDRPGGSLLQAAAHLLSPSVVESEVMGVLEADVRLVTGREVCPTESETLLSSYQVIVVFSAEAADWPCHECIIRAGHNGCEPCGVAYRIARGKRAALRAVEAVAGVSLVGFEAAAMTPLKLSCWAPPPGRRSAGAAAPPRVALGGVLTEGVFPEITAQQQAARCLQCHVTVACMSSAQECAGCRACIAACPENALRAVPADWVPGLAGDGRALLYDPNVCSRCGVCARVCGSLEMQALNIRRETGFARA